MKILVRATNWVGDAVMSLPALRALRERFPGARISILAKPWVADLYQGWQIIPFEGASWSLIQRLRRERFEFDDYVAAQLPRQQLGRKQV